MSSNEERIEATKSLLFFGNVITALWIALGTISFWLTNSTLGWIFLGFSAFSILVLLRRQMCSSCYYCKSCTKGFAKLSRLFIGKSHIPGIGKGSEIGMAVFIYSVLSVVPGILLVSSMLQGFSLLRLVLSICLLTISTLNVANRVRSW
jgi:hypothetical protein